MSSKTSELRQSLPQRKVENEINSNHMLDLTVVLMNESSVTTKVTERPNCLTAKDVLNKVLSKNNNTDKIEFDFDIKFKKLFSIWITSPYLELQLQPQHRPFNLLAKWDSLLKKHGPIELITDPTLIEKDEPTLTLQRNVFCDQTIETEIEETDIGALYLLYFEAKMNVLDGRYPTNSEELEPKGDFELLAAYQTIIESGPYNTTNYSVEHFRQNLKDYIPFNYLKSSNGLIRTLSRSTPSMRCSQKIHDKYKELSNQKLSEYKLLKSYLEICWKIPCYGSAYFSAQIEKPIKSRIESIVSHFDLEIWVAINEKGLHLISKEKPELLLSIDHMDLIWAVGCPNSSDPNCIPCIFIQMLGDQNGEQIQNEILQIFSRQHQLIEALLNSFIKETKKSLNSRNNSISNSNRNSNRDSYDVTDGPIPSAHVSIPLEASKPVYSRQISQNTKIYKAERLSLAKFNSSGKCLNKTGSFLRVLKDKN